MNLLEQFKKVKVFVFDVDGVLTDGTVLLGADGLQMRKMHVRDGLALQMALNNGYHVVIVSGAYSQPVVDRMHYLGITEVFTAVKNKKEFLLNYCKDRDLNIEEVVFMGDDLPDLEAMEIAGLAGCPADAATEVQAISHYISPVKGGFGCVRDVIEKILRLNGQWHHHSGITSK
jgi:3-deoxy-D-manno-octulosonate 8-phosphate phosphatase (KDO 8-P phosphatase)